MAPAQQAVVESEDENSSKSSTRTAEHFVADMSGAESRLRRPTAPQQDQSIRFAGSIQEAKSSHANALGEEEDVFNSLVSGTYTHETQMLPRYGGHNAYGNNAEPSQSFLTGRNGIQGLVQNATVRNSSDGDDYMLSDERQASAAAATSKDLAEIYKEVGGLGTALGKQLFNIYSRGAAAAERERISTFYIRRAASAGRQLRKAPDPEADHKMKVAKRYQEYMQRKNSYQVPKLKSTHQPAPMSRQAMMLALMPRRKPQAAIAAEIEVEFGHAVRTAQKAVVPSAVLETRDDKIRKLQDRMENGANPNAPSTVSKGSLRNAGRASAPPPPVSEEDKLIDAVLQEIDEREDFLRRLQEIRASSGASAKLSKQEGAVLREIQERYEELSVLKALKEGYEPDSEVLTRFGLKQGRQPRKR